MQKVTSNEGSEVRTSNDGYISTVHRHLTRARGLGTLDVWSLGFFAFCNNGMSNSWSLVKVIREVLLSLYV